MTGYFDYLKSMLQPLRVYRFDGTYVGVELQSLANALDGAAETIRQRQENVTDPGTGGEALDGYRQMMPLLDGDASEQQCRRFIRAVLQMPGKVLSKRVINDLLGELGVNAVVREGSEPFTAEVVLGENEDTDRAKQILETVLPCHLNVVYVSE